MVRQGTKTLMMKRVKKSEDVHYGNYNWLGGKIEPGESPQEAAIREIREESGLIATDPELRGMITFPNFAGKEDILMFIFTCNYDGIIDTSFDCKEGHLELIDDEIISSLPLWYGDLIFKKWIDENKPMFSAKFTYEGKMLKDTKVKFYGGQK